jgi:outer membrane lipoprotein LolB
MKRLLLTDGAANCRARHFVLALAFLLAGCAGLAPLSGTGQRTAPPADGASATRHFYESIRFSGRLSVRYQQEGKDEAVHGSFTWRQTPQHTTVTLLTPLGQTIATIDIAPGRATIMQANQAPRTAPDADMLALQTLGWPLPLAGLQHWLQGFAIDASNQRFVARPGAGDANSVTTRDGWTIRYVGWEPGMPGGHLHPRRIDLQRDTTQAGEVAIRIVIDTAQAI